jgi:hypothetical protein
MATTLFASNTPSQDAQREATQVITSRLAYNSPATVFAGGLPPHAVVLDITVYTTTAFNAGTQNNIVIGQSDFSGTNPSAYTAGTAIGPLGVVKVPLTMPSSLPLARPTSITLKYDQAGTPANAGSALVIVRYVVQRRDIQSIALDTSSAGTWPNASNTGPAAGTVFTTTTGNFNTSSAGQIVEKRQIDNGMVIIRHPNVIIRDCIINSQDSAAISTVGAALSGCLVERCLLTGIGGANGISPDFAPNIEIRFCDISGYVNGIVIGDTGMNIHDNYIHGLFSITGPGSHIDGIQGAGGFTSLIIRHNTIVSWDTSCIILQTEGGGFSGVVIDNNRCLFDAAHVGSELGYGILCQSINANVAQDVTITNNRIQKSQLAQNYIFIHNLTNPVTISGNVDDTTGLPVTADIG